MASQSAYAGNALNVPSGHGQPWDDALLAIDGQDGSYARAVSGLAVSDYLVLCGFRFALPDLANVTGVTATVYRRGDGGTADYAVQLVTKDDPVGNNKATSGAWSAHADGEKVDYGGAGDTWGLALSGSAVNLEAFGVAIACRAMDEITMSGEVDAVYLTVYYDEPPGQAPSTFAISPPISSQVIAPQSPLNPPLPPIDEPADVVDHDTLAAIRARWLEDPALPTLLDQPVRAGRLPAPGNQQSATGPYATAWSELQSREVASTSGAVFDVRKVTITIRGVKADVVAALGRLGHLLNRLVGLTYPSGARFIEWWSVGGGAKLTQEQDPKAGHDVWKGEIEGEVKSVRT